jgi:hypothetical protein
MPKPDLDDGSRSLSQLRCRTPEGTLAAFAPAIGASEDDKRSCFFILSSFFSRVAERLSSPANTGLIKFQSIINNIVMKINATNEERKMRI